MRLRRVFILTLAAFFLCAACPGAALAMGDFTTDGVRVSDIRINPPALEGAGTVAVTIKVSVETSRAGGGIASVRVEGAGVASDTVHDVAIGGSADLNFLLQVAASQLGAPITLVLVWEGAASGLAFEVTVPSAAPQPTEPQVSFTRTIDKSAFSLGDSLTLIYNIENTGTVDITDLTVTDGGIPDMTLKRSTLRAGGNAALSHTYEPSREFTSTPKLTFKANGKTYTATCDAKTVSLRSLLMEARLEASPAQVDAGGDVTLLCTLENTGNVKLTDVIISEKTLGNRLFPPATLDKGTSRQFSRMVSLTKTATFRYEITARDESGNTVTFQSNDLEVKVSSAGQYDISISAMPDMLQLSQPGRVNFNITVTNAGGETVTNAVVKDQSGMTIGQYASLPAGETKLNYARDIDTTTQFDFSLSATGGDGTTFEVRSGAVEIVVAGPAATATVPAAPTPEATGLATASPEEASSRMSGLLTALIIVGFLIVVTVFVLVGMIIADKRKRAGAKR